MSPPASAPAKKPSLLVFIVAYFAESTLREVLERIPPAIFQALECAVLVVDDASEDRTLEIGREYQEAHPEIRVTVLRNANNQGYGGNQKVGYAYAIRERFDFVAMLHGDGQYAPEELPHLVGPLLDGSADAVLGSRMLDRFAALRGMPIYKFVGNRILTATQNWLLGTKLSEFHSGYRIYSVRMLEKIPFLLNANDFHFDTEIVVQLLNADARITELPIPAYHGREISPVNGIGYAKNVLVATLKNVAHRSGILYQRRYDPTQGDNARYDLKLGYASSHTYALAAIPKGARVVDVGSGSGEMDALLVDRGCRVTAIDQYAPETAVMGVDVVLQDLDSELTFDVREQDYILMLDIIEHLRRPEQFLEDLRSKFDHTSRTVILTTPNIAFIVQRIMLLFGQFNYGKAGILDRTHTRLFTFRSIQQLLRDTGFEIKKVKGVPAPFPKVFGNGRLGRAAIGLNLLLIRLSKTVFSYQIYIEAETRPDVAFLLRDARARQPAGTLAGDER